MAPEQVEGKEADARSDIWALGALIYEMVTGTRPFRGDTPASVIGAILRDDPPPVSTRQPIAPIALENWSASALQRTPTSAGSRQRTSNDSWNGSSSTTARKPQDSNGAQRGRAQRSSPHRLSWRLLLLPWGRKMWLLQLWRPGSEETPGRAFDGPDGRSASGAQFHRAGGVHISSTSGHLARRPSPGVRGGQRSREVEPVAARARRSTIARSAWYGRGDGYRSGRQTVDASAFSLKVCSSWQTLTPTARLR